MTWAPRDQPMQSPVSIYGNCLLHGKPVSERDGICPECRVQNELTEGDYLRESGRPRAPRYQQPR